jgi:hypothetical protein
MRTEAVYLDLVTADAQQALVMRLCRYPADGIAWVWGHLFEGGRVFAFIQHDVPSSVRETAVDATVVTYAVEGTNCRLGFDRNGALGSVSDAHGRGAFEMHDCRHAPLGPGPILVEMDVSFTPTAAAVSNLDGRSEVLGVGQATVTIGTRSWRLAGGSQFHEQVQTAPRFTAPFTYGTLRGDRAGTIFIRGAKGARGHWIEGDTTEPIDRIELSPPGSARTIVIHTGDRLRTGSLHTVYDYSIALPSGYRPGSVVAGQIDGVPVSGCVNDFLLDRLDYDRI